MDTYPMVELTGAEVLEATDRILDLMAELRSEAAIAACTLIAYGLIRGKPITKDEAQEVLNRFTTFAVAGEDGVQ